ncbi:20359_t:CDS:2, partial [Dentiscutata erythropus]
NNQIIVNDQTLKERITQIITKYIDDENLSIDLFKLTVQYKINTNKRVKQCDFFNYDTRKKLGDETKTGNKIVISYITRMADKHETFWNQNNLYLKHVNDVSELGKRKCNKCSRHKFCCENTIVNNNCCFIETCMNINVVNPPINFRDLNLISYGFMFINQIQPTYTHKHTLCKDCFDICLKNSVVEFLNDFVWKCS